MCHNNSNMLIQVIFVLILHNVIMIKSFSTISRVIFNEFTNLNAEQTLIMAYNYSQTFFDANMSVK